MAGRSIGGVAADPPAVPKMVSMELNCSKMSGLSFWRKQ